MNSLNLSILIISFNCWDLLDSCISSILATKYPFLEIVVIDNASVDGTPDKLRMKYPQVQLTENSHNTGHTRAVNQGVKLTKGDTVLLLDADTELKHDAIHLMVDFLEKHREVSLVAPRLLNSDGTIQESARNFPTPMSGIFGRQSLLRRVFPNNPFSKYYLALEHHSSQEPYRVEHVSAAAMLFRKPVFTTAGQWDEGYHSYWVDADFCKRIQKVGGIIYCIPEAVIIHHEQNKRAIKKSYKRIVNFHKGAHRFYLLHYTKGKGDPRNLIASLFLTIRTILLLISNHFKKSSESQIDPLSLHNKKS